MSPAQSVSTAAAPQGDYGEGTGATVPCGPPSHLGPGTLASPPPVALGFGDTSTVARCPWPCRRGDLSRL